MSAGPYATVADFLEALESDASGYQFYNRTGTDQTWAMHAHQVVNPPAGVEKISAEEFLEIARRLPESETSRPNGYKAGA